MSRYRLLDEFYEREHCCRLTEDGQEIHILRPRTHNEFHLMVYDDRYTPLLRRVGFHTVANLLRWGMPVFNPAALTALVNRWRPMTHTFHLPCGEMTITLQDVAMILGLPIRGQPVVGPAVSEGWRARVEAFLGTPLPPVPENARRGCVSGVHISCLRATFGVCPEHADDATVTYHCRAWVLHMFGAVLFLDATGDAASWMYIHCLQDWVDAGQFSWGSVVLAFLYRQLCEACRCKAPTSSSVAASSSCRFDRVCQRKVTDFAHHHRDYVLWWRRMEDNCKQDNTPHTNASFWDYLSWYHAATHYRLRQQSTDVAYADLASSEDEDTAYDRRAREGTVVEAAPILDRVGTSLQTSVREIDEALIYQVGDLDSESHRLRDLLKRLRRRISWATGRCGCRTRSDVIILAASQRSGALAAAASSSHAGRRQSTRSSSCTPTFSQGDDDDDAE